MSKSFETSHVSYIYMAQLHKFASTIYAPFDFRPSKLFNGENVSIGGLATCVLSKLCVI